jgi:glycosyltransferase involved in cell wall biosynthesis
MAHEMLGSRLRITHVPSSEVPALYRVADVMVHAALEESFGLAIVEALCSGTPVLVHDSPHFEWLLGGSEGLVDMATEGSLAERLRELAARQQRRSIGMRTRSDLARNRFDWKVVSRSYVELYRKLAA